MNLWGSFCHAMLCISTVYAIMRCPSVCPSVCPSGTFVNSVKTSNRIFQFFSPSGSHTILVFFRTKRHGNIPTGTPKGCVECRWGRHKSQFWANSYWIDDCCSALSTIDVVSAVVYNSYAARLFRVETATH